MRTDGNGPRLPLMRTMRKGRKERKGRTLWTLAVLCAVAAAARAEPLVVQDYRCTREGQARLISVRLDDEAGTRVCDVRYRKLTEVLDHDEVLWKANSGIDFCQEKAQALQAKLGGWGWDCGARSRARPAVARPAVEEQLDTLRGTLNGAFASVEVRVIGDLVATGDLDGDGDDDAVVAFSTEASRSGVRAALGVFINEGDGEYRQRAIWPLGRRWPTRLLIREGRIEVGVHPAAARGRASSDLLVYRWERGRVAVAGAD